MPEVWMTLVPLKPKSKPSTSNEADMHHHDHDMMNHEAHTAAASHGMEQQDMHMSMQSSVNIADPMSRESSGTAWVPDSTQCMAKCSCSVTICDVAWRDFPALYECEHTARRRPDRCAQLDHGMYSHPLGDSAQLGGAK